MGYSELELKAIEFTIGKKGGAGNEGGFSNNPNDKGGATFSGFTIGTLRRLSAQIHSHDFDKDGDGDIDVEDLKKLDWDDLVVMADTYWNPMYDQIVHPIVAIKTYDFGFNCGTVSGAKLLQKAVNRTLGRDAVVVDGKFGPKSLSMVNSCGADILLKNLIQVAKEHYQDIVNADPTQQGFLKGWFNRANKLPY